MFDEMHAYDAVIAENFLKGKTEGMAEGKSEGKTEGHADAISVMQAMGLPPEKIAEAKARLEALKSKQSLQFKKQVKVKAHMTVSLFLQEL